MEYSRTEMVDGHPVTYKLWYGLSKAYRDDKLLADLPQEIQDAVIDWINQRIRPAENFCKKYGFNSGDLTRSCERDLKLEFGVITHNTFKDAMLTAGYNPVLIYAETWQFCIKPRLYKFKKGATTNART